MVVRIERPVKRTLTFGAEELIHVKGLLFDGANNFYPTADRVNLL